MKCKPLTRILKHNPSNVKPDRIVVKRLPDTNEWCAIGYKGNKKVMEYFTDDKKDAEDTAAFERKRMGIAGNPGKGHAMKIEVWRSPTKSEIKFGYGSLHYKTITVSTPPKGGQKFKIDGKMWTYGSRHNPSKNWDVKYARLEPSKDEMVKKYAPQAKWMDVVVYNDRVAQRRYAVFPAHFTKSKPRRGVKSAMINGYRWRLVWLPTLAKNPRRSGRSAYSRKGRGRVGAYKRVAANKRRR